MTELRGGLHATAAIRHLSTVAALPHASRALSRTGFDGLGDSLFDRELEQRRVTCGRRLERPGQAAARGFGRLPSQP